MTRNDVFDAVFDAVYSSVFTIIGEKPDGDDECSIDWDEDVTDKEIDVEVKIKIKPGQKCRVYAVDKRKKDWLQRHFGAD